MNDTTVWRPALGWRSVAATDRGKVREHNEDAFLERPDLGLWAVADGMGGHVGGARASRMVVERLGRAQSRPNIDAFEDQVVELLRGVNDALREGVEGPNPVLSGSTVAALLLRDGEASCVWAGDSRIYRSRGGRLAQLSSDHTQANEYVAKGLLAAEGARQHRTGNVLTRAVGGARELHPERVRSDLLPGDVFLLCSDGLTDAVPDEEIAVELNRLDIRRACSNLIDRALARGAKDNVTVLIVLVEDGPNDDRTILHPAMQGQFG